MKAPGNTSRRALAPGIIRADCAYSLAALSRETGLGAHGLRQLRSLGLRMPYVGRERWVLGADFLELVKRLRDNSGRRSDNGSDNREGS